MRRGWLLATLPTAMLAACSSFESDAGSETETTIDGGASSSTSSSSSGSAPDGGPVDGGHEEVAPLPDFRSVVGGLPALLGHWRLDDVAVKGALDSAGPDHGVIVPGDDATKSGALMFASAAIKVTPSASSALGVLGPAFTVGVLIKPDEDLGFADNVFLAKEGEFQLGVHTSRIPFLDVTGASTPRFDGTLTLSPKTRGLVIATIDGKKLEAQLWVNGNRATKAITTAPSHTTSTPLCIGGFGMAGFAKCELYPYKGIIDEVFVVNAVVPDATIRQLTSLAGLPE
jgi:hypothetical protein